MRKAIIIAALAASVCLLGGCDFFRQLAGRPTSQEIAAKRVLIEQAETAARQREDSLKAAEALAREQRRQHIADSLALVDSLRRSTGRVVISSKRVDAAGTQLAYRYYVMIGAFSSPDNASRQAAKAESAGYPATKIPFKNGFIAVGICPTNSLTEAYASLKKVSRESFCPADAWIINNE